MPGDWLESPAVPLEPRFNIPRPTIIFSLSSMHSYSALFSEREKKRQFLCPIISNKRQTIWKGIRSCSDFLFSAWLAGPVWSFMDLISPSKSTSERLYTLYVHIGMGWLRRRKNSIIHLHGTLQLPWYALMVFGCYALANIGFNLMTFQDCPQASEELRCVRMKGNR